MEITIVDDTVRCAKGGAKASAGRPGSGGFDMAMAAVMALLMPNSGAPPPAPNPVAEGAVITEDIARPAAGNKNAQKFADVTQYGLLPGTPAFAVLDPDGTVAKDVIAGEAQMLPQTDQAGEESPAASGRNAEAALKKAGPAPENFASGQAAAAPDSLTKGLASIEAAEAAGTAPSGLTGDAGKTAHEKTPAGTFPPGANARAAAAIVKTAVETLPGYGMVEAEKTEGKLDDTLSGKIAADGTAAAASGRNAEAALKEAGPAPEKFALGQAAAAPDSLTKGLASIEAAEAAGTAPSGLTGDAGKTAHEKTPAGTFPPGANARAAAATVKTAVETLPGYGMVEAEKTEEKLNGVLAGKIVADGTVAAASGRNAEAALKEAGLTGDAGKTAHEKTPAGTFPPGANARAAAATVKTAVETLPGYGMVEAEKTEGKLDDTLSGKIATGGTGAAGEAKNESEGFNNTPEGAFQTDPEQINAAGTQPDPAKNLKQVSLPELKDVVVQEIKQFYDTRKGAPARIQIKLEPENLGKLTIRISYSNGELNAHFYTGSDHVKEILQGSLQQLRESLGRQELTLNQAFVFVGGENSDGGAGNQTAHGNRRAEYFPNSRPATSRSNLEPDDYYRLDSEYPGVNYLI